MWTSLVSWLVVGMASIGTWLLYFPSYFCIVTLATHCSVRIRLFPWYIHVFAQSIKSVNQSCLSSRTTGRLIVNKNTMLVQTMLSGNDFLKSHVLNRWRKVESDRDATCNVIGQRVVSMQETVMNLRLTFCVNFRYKFLKRVSPALHCVELLCNKLLSML